MQEIDFVDMEDPGSYPVLIIPGYGAPAFQTDLLGKKLQSAGLDTVKLRLPWMAMGDMSRSAGIVAEQVQRIRENLGYEKVNLFGYSLGGLIARYYLQELGGYPFLSRGAFIAAPNYGTYFGYLGFFSSAGRQVRPGSQFIKELNSSPLYESVADRCLSIYVRWDGVIIPSESSYLPHGYNMALRRPVMHWLAVMNEAIINRASEFLHGELPEGAFHGRDLGMLEAGSLVPVPVDVPARRAYWSIFAGPFLSLFRRVMSAFKR